jgi:hypothetical protein
MNTIAKRARDLVARGASYSEYACNQLVHYALTGDNGGRLAKEYLKYGEVVTGTPQEGDVVVGTNGKHCGIFVDSSHFVHASFSKQKAVELESKQLKDVFPDGYQIRRQ